MRSIPKVLSSAVILVAGARGALALQYTITNVGTLGSGGATAQGINASGQVAGMSGPHAFGTASTAGVINAATDDKGVLGTGSASYGQAINASGQVAGYGAIAFNQSTQHAFRADIGQPMADLGTLGGTNSKAYDINNAGRVVGQADASGGFFRAFRTAANSAINPATDDLGSLGSGYSTALTINNLGQVGGYSLPITGGTHAFRTTPGGVIDASADLGQLYAGLFSQVLDINDQGNAVGSGNYANNTFGVTHAFFVPAGRGLLSTDDLGTLPGGTVSYATGLNSSNVIVGVSGGTLADADDGHAVIWYGPGTSPIDLNSLIPANSGWILTRAYGINDAGQITGFGRYSGYTSGFSSFVLNVAVPEPATVGVFALAGTLILPRRRRPSRAK